MKIISQSHLDHSLTQAHIDFIMKHWALIRVPSGLVGQDVTPVMVELPAELESLPCGLVGPSTGFPAVSDENDSVTYHVRKGRKWASRMIDQQVHMTRTLTYIVGHYNGEEVLFTAYGGYCAPREPGDTSLNTMEEITLSRKFWAEHALTWND